MYFCFFFVDTIHPQVYNKDNKERETGGQKNDKIRNRKRIQLQKHMRSQLHLDLHSNGQNRENHHGNRRKENKETQNNSKAERIQGSRNGIPGRTILDGADAKRIRKKPSPAAKPGRRGEALKMKKYRSYAEIEKDIKRLEKRIEKETDLKKRTFLAATINAYSKEIGKPEPHKW